MYKSEAIFRLYKVDLYTGKYGIVQFSVFSFKGLSWQAVESPDKFGLSPLMIAGILPFLTNF